jgi:hypothetical protein
MPVLGVVPHDAQRREQAAEEELRVGERVDEGSEVEQLADPHHVRPPTIVPASLKVV